MVWEYSEKKVGKFARERNAKVFTESLDILTELQSVLRFWFCLCESLTGEFRWKSHILKLLVGCERGLLERSRQ